MEEFKKYGIIKYGEFELKSGIKTDVYLDAKSIISYPELNSKICDKICQYINPEIELVCGVPYGAISFASYVSISENIPMIMLRKEQKDYGTKKLIEGNFKQDQKVALIEDVVTTGISIIETAEKLSEQGLEVCQIISIFREQKQKFFNHIPVQYLYHIDD